MPSPFPGMNPYFESYDFQEFHAGYLFAIQAAINRLLPPGYRAKYESEVVIREPSADERRAWAKRADVAVEADGSRGPGAPAATGGPAITQTNVVTATLPPPEEEETKRWLTVVSRDEGRVVTHLELLSPSNKGKDRVVYVQKRGLLLRSEANFIELDLLRAGPRLPVEGVPDRPFYAMVSRPDERPRATVWSFGLRDRMPTIPVPLAEGDADVPLDLQAALDDAYDRVLYDRDPRLYAGAPDPPLSAEDAAWAADLLAAAGAR